MNTLEIAVSIACLIATIGTLFYLLRFRKNEGGDERSSQIMGQLGVRLYSMLLALISVLMILEISFDLPYETYKLGITCIILAINIAYVLTLHRLRKQY